MRTDLIEAPWENHDGVIVTSTGEFICDTTPPFESSGPANVMYASLIIATPELLEALKDVVRVADRDTVEFKAARSAIAKAEGREAK